MDGVFSQNGGVSISNVFYRYRLEKELEADARVTVRNNSNLGGYVFSETDVWDGLQGNTINKIIPLPDIQLGRFGTGEIVVEGEAVVEDASVIYSYKEDLCFNPLYSPACPGYREALLALVPSEGDYDLSNPILDKEIESMKKTQVDSEEADLEEEEEKEEIDDELLDIIGDTLKLINETAQTAQLIQLSNVAILQNYYTVEITGGTYNDVVVMKDSELQDNRRVLRNFASQKLHEDMVNEQYNR